MSAASFVVMQGRENRRNTAAAVLFFDWAYRTGSQTAKELGYAPIPPAVADRVRASWAAALGKGGPPDVSRK
jgi:phosphate transport system substrate-binding protein